ncbi:hypothetical protein M0802_008186 [Mischocyttarus mexicanus]|nr:hypothetical protein M0802_008186 [Mischocyttarus mexicanus]
MCMSLSLFQIVVVLKRSSETFRYIAFTTAQIVHIFCMCYPGQKLIDYSTDVRIKALVILSTIIFSYFINISFMILIILLEYIIQVALLFTSKGDIDVVLECIPSITVSLLMIIKYYTFMIQRNNKLFLQVENLLKHTIKNWQIWETQKEIDIMHEFAVEGRVVTLVYIIYICSSELLFFLLPLFPRLMDVFVPLNESRPLRTIVRAYYFVDEQEYFFSIYCHMSIVIMIGTAVLLASDTLFVVFNSHLCGLFSTIGFRLEHLLNDRFYSEILLDSKTRKTYFDHVVHSIKNHKRALEFAGLIESSYSISFLIQSFMGLIGLSVSLFQILVFLDKKPEALRFLVFAAAQLAHLFCLCYPGQRMIDYSTEIQIKAYNGLWYEAPIEVHRLLLLVIRRSLEPCCLTAGKIFIFCLETFSKVYTFSKIHTYSIKKYSFIFFLDRPNFRLVLHDYRQVALICTCNGDIDLILESVPFICVFIAMVIKYYTYQFQKSNIQDLLNHMLNNWQIWETREEMNIMHKFAVEGRFFTLVYTWYIYICMVLFLAMPLFPRFMDILAPLNESRPLRSIVKSYYFVNEQEYFYSIHCHMSIEITVGITILIAADSLFLTFNSHICGLFSAVGFRLERLLNDRLDSEVLLDHRIRKMYFDNVAHSIKNHKRALEFAKLIESSYSVSFLMQAFMGLICLSVSMFQILVLLDKKAEAFTFTIFACAQFIHLLCICYPGQRMIDYSTEIRFKAYSGLWYEAPIEVHRLLLLIIRRSLEPCCLTAGKTFIFCLETFAKNVSCLWCDMDIFKDGLYNFNYRLLSFIGLWPYQKSRLCRFYMSNIMLLFLNLPQSLKLWTSRGDFNIILQIIPVWCTAVNIIIKYYTCRLGLCNMRILCNNIIVDWQIWNSKEEIDIMKRYAKEGQLNSLLYAGYVYFTTIMYIGITFVPRLMDVIEPLNESRPLKLPILSEYFLDQEEYFYPLYATTFFSLLFGVTILIAFDTQLMIFTCHVCSMFAVVGYRLEHFLKDAHTIDNWSNHRRKKYIEDLLLSINTHKSAIKFANCIESSFSYSLLIQCGFNIICMAISLYQISEEMGNQLAETLRYTTFIIAQLFHMFCSCYIGQMIIDHSTNIGEKVSYKHRSHTLWYYHQYNNHKRY